MKVRACEFPPTLSFRTSPSIFAWVCPSEAMSTRFFVHGLSVSSLLARSWKWLGSSSWVWKNLWLASDIGDPEKGACYRVKVAFPPFAWELRDACFLFARRSWLVLWAALRHLKCLHDDVLVSFGPSPFGVAGSVPAPAWFLCPFSRILRPLSNSCTQKTRALTFGRILDNP